ncbi:MAG: hypothetical protein CVU64_00655 [Deltaproteobacteria bacterium HGW-Deltaproteobacteria-21]|nr:MAG: hypothetical protein CVU64_00655 [Deltaproteobacteria bacterium HGW-Deltaproteobacteria-21]
MGLFLSKTSTSVEDPERFYRSGVKSWLENPNLEYRNSKQRNSNSNFQMTETKIPERCKYGCFGHLVFGHLNLFRASIFEFRISASLEMGQI